MNKTIQKLKKLYPKTGKIVIGYQGSGDQFDDFYDVEAYVALGKNKNLKEFEKNRPVSEEIKKIDEDVRSHNSFISSVIFDAFEKHDGISFNDEGCSGLVNIDLDEGSIKIENTYYYTSSEESPLFEYTDYPGE
jgi:hypothetical protein